MTQHEHDLRRQELEARYRAALAILEAGHRAQVEELERLWQAERETEPQSEAPAPVPEPVRRWGVSLLAECRDALDRLPEEFDKDDLLRVLGFSPHRSSLFRALQQLGWEGRIAVTSVGSNRKASVYRQLPPRSGSETPR
jgi:hypothetical protein